MNAKVIALAAFVAVVGFTASAAKAETAEEWKNRICYIIGVEDSQRILGYIAQGIEDPREITFLEHRRLGLSLGLSIQDARKMFSNMREQVEIILKEYRARGVFYKGASLPERMFKACMEENTLISKEGVAKYNKMKKGDHLAKK